MKAGAGGAGASMTRHKSPGQVVTYGQVGHHAWGVLVMLAPGNAPELLSWKDVIKFIFKLSELSQDLLACSALPRPETNQ